MCSNLISIAWHITLDAHRGSLGMTYAYSSYSSFLKIVDVIIHLFLVLPSFLSVSTFRLESTQLGSIFMYPVIAHSKKCYSFSDFKFVSLILTIYSSGFQNHPEAIIMYGCLHTWTINSSDFLTSPVYVINVSTTCSIRDSILRLYCFPILLD